MGRPLAQLFSQGWRCEVVVVERGGMMGRLVGLSGQVEGYEVVVGVVKTVGLLARSIGQG